MTALNAHGNALNRIQRRAPQALASAKKQSKSQNADFSKMGSTDADGYRRGSFGIGENESKLIWGAVFAALIFGGALDDETAQKIGAAQREFYPKPPGMEQADALKAKSTNKGALSDGLSTAFPTS
jgi:hypothetical protein